MFVTGLGLILRPLLLHRILHITTEFTYVIKRHMFRENVELQRKLQNVV